MPRNGSGNYSLPAGNPVVSEDVITSDWANSTLDDLASAMTDSLSRTGEGGMLAPFRVADGTNNAPGVAFTLETSSGIYRAGSGEWWAVVGSVPISRFTFAGVLLPTGKTLTVGGAISGGATLAIAGNGTIGGTLGVTGMLTAGGIASDITGNVTAVSGTSAFYDVTVGHSLSMGGFIISALADPVADTDAATKQYVDSVAQGLSAKASCLAATTGNITLSGEQTIDGVAVLTGERVLVKNQGTSANNGIYLANSGAWVRAPDANTWEELVSAFTFVTSGTANANNGYVCTVAPGGTLGVTAVTWAQFSGAGQITAGAGLTKVGNTIDVVTANSGRIVVNADNIDLASGIVTPGAYTKVTVDTYGRVTVGANPTTLAGYGITDAYTTTYIDTLFGSTASAATSATAAANSATAASGSATAALASENAAAATYDAFDDRYLGSKTSDPTVDNDGNPLISGALYWNSVAAEMRVYNLAGLVWVSAYLPSSVYVAGPSSATDNAIARFDATTGKLIQNSVVTISDTGAVSGVTTVGTVSGQLGLMSSVNQIGAIGAGNTNLFNSNTSLGTDLKTWSWRNAGNFQITAVNDAFSGSTDAYVIARGTTYNVASHTWSTSAVAGTPVQGLQLTNTALTISNSHTLSLNGSAIPINLNGSVGTAGQVLVSAGAGATPTWGAGSNPSTGYSFTNKSAPYTTAASDVICATAATTITIGTLTTGQFCIVARDTTAGSVVADRNSQTIDGSATNFMFDINKPIVLFLCTGSGTLVTRLIGYLPT